MQALIGGAVDYAATAFDVASRLCRKGGNIRRFATTGGLPLFCARPSARQRREPSPS
jgi:NitT/TauT family transport system substrate-binding protein